MTRRRSFARRVAVRTTSVVAVIASVLAATPSRSRAQALEPIAYTVRVPAPETRYAQIDATVPTGGRASIEMMMPVWSPGYYRLEDYAGRVDLLDARTPDGEPLRVERPAPNRWRIDTGGRPAIRLSYRVFCSQRSVTTNWVDRDYGVFNGAPTFITLVEQARRPHEVRIELPPSWTRAMTGLDEASDRAPNHFRAPDYDTLVDSPIVAGSLVVREFDVAGKRHVVAGAGDTANWDADAAARDLAAFVGEAHRFWGFLPYEKYVFLLRFGQGGGGLEHRNSTLSTLSARGGGAGAAPGAASRVWAGMGLLSHEYFHLFNVKRLRPIELGPFDYEHPPRTGSLWIAEGVTSYYSGLLMARAGQRTRDEHLASLSSLIGRIQNAPGRLLQSVEQSSLEVWTNSNSGVGASASTVSYYDKGHLLGALLDAKIRRVTSGRRSFDDVMRLAYRRYSGDRGYTAAEFRAAAREVAGVDLDSWFRSAVSSTDELDYTDLLEWFGLQFTTAEGGAKTWILAVRADATVAQKRNLDAYLAASRVR